MPGTSSGPAGEDPAKHEPHQDPNQLPGADDVSIEVGDASAKKKKKSRKGKGGKNRGTGFEGES